MGEACTQCFGHDGGKAALTSSPQASILNSDRSSSFLALQGRSGVRHRRFVASAAARTPSGLIPLLFLIFLTVKVAGQKNQAARGTGNLAENYMALER
jgi:hypothetical protein